MCVCACVCTTQVAAARVMSGVMCEVMLHCRHARCSRCPPVSKSSRRCLPVPAWCPGPLTGWWINSCIISYMATGATMTVVPTNTHQHTNTPINSIQERRAPYRQFCRVRVHHFAQFTHIHSCMWTHWGRLNYVQSVKVCTLVFAARKCATQVQVQACKPQAERAQRFRESELEPVVINVSRRRRCQRS